MVFRARVPLPAAADTGRTIDARGVVGFHRLHEGSPPLHPTSCGLIAGGKHDERGMVAIGIKDGAPLVHEVFVDGLAVAELHTVVGPRRSFGLQVDAEAVGSHEGSLGRAIAVEADVVETVLLTFPEQTHPRGGVGGRIARLREAAVLHGATQMNGVAVEEDITFLHLHLAETEGDADGHPVVTDGGGVELWVVFVPRLGTRDMDVVGAVVEGDMRRRGGEVGDDTATPDEGLAAQLDAAGDAVPVTLRLVGDAVTILSHADILDAVIDADGELVVATIAEVGRDIVLMRCGEGHLVAHLTAVDEDGGLDMRTLQEEGDTLSAPLLGNAHRATIYSLPHEMVPGCEEERELHRPRLAVALHVGVEEIAGVIEGTRPAGIHGDRVADATGNHGTGQLHGGFGQPRAQAPGAGEVETEEERAQSVQGCHEMHSG